MVVVPVYLQTLARIDLISPLLGELKAREYFETYVSRTWFGLALGMAGVYAMHGICWKMGQIFREKGASFGWAWEQHEANRQAVRIQREVELQRRLVAKSAPAATQQV